VRHEVSNLELALYVIVGIDWDLRRAEKVGEANSKVCVCQPGGDATFKTPYFGI
jgi:hypothetical protein